MQKQNFELNTEKYQHLLKFDVVKNWVTNKYKLFVMKGKNPKKFNHATYFGALQKYLDFTKLTPDKLLAEEIEAGNNRMIDFVNYYIQDLKKNPVSVKNAYVSRILSFYSYNSHRLTVKIATEGEGLNNNELLLTKELIRKIYNKLQTLNYRWIFLTELSTGLRISDILDELPKYEDKIQEYKDRTYIPKFKTVKEGVTVNFLIFTKELTDLIKASGKTLTELTQTRNEKTIDQNNYRRRLQNIVDELGIDKNMKTHCIRKYYKSEIGFEMPSQVFNQFAGHKQELDTYWKPKIENIGFMFEKFFSIESQISVYFEQVDHTDEKIIEFEEKLKEKDDQIQLLQSEVVQLKQEVTNSSTLTIKLLEAAKRSLDSADWEQIFNK